MGSPPALRRRAGGGGWVTGALLLAPPPRRHRLAAGLRHYGARRCACAHSGAIAAATAADLT